MGIPILVRWYLYIDTAPRQQSITWTNVDQDICRLMLSLGHNELSWRYCKQYCASQHNSFKDQAYIDFIYRYPIFKKMSCTSLLTWQGAGRVVPGIATSNMPHCLQNTHKRNPIAHPWDIYCNLNKVVPYLTVINAGQWAVGIYCKYCVMNRQPLLRVRSWNNGMHCMSSYNLIVKIPVKVIYPVPMKYSWVPYY